MNHHFMLFFMFALGISFSSDLEHIKKFVIMLPTTGFVEGLVQEILVGLGL